MKIWPRLEQLGREVQDTVTEGKGDKEVAEEDRREVFHEVNDSKQPKQEGRR